MHIGWKIPIWKNHPIKMGRSSEDDGEIVEIWKNNIPNDITLAITYNICLNDR